MIPGIPDWLFNLLWPVLLPILAGAGVGLLSQLPEPYSRIVRDVLDALRSRAEKSKRENEEGEAEAAVLAAEQLIKPGAAGTDDEHKQRNRDAFKTADAILRGKRAKAKQEELRPEIEAALARVKGKGLVK